MTKTQIHYMFLSWLLAAGLLLVMNSPVHAASISFSNFDHRGDHPLDYIVTVDDSPADAFLVEVSITSSGGIDAIGDISGVFFDASLLLTASDITGVTGDIQRVGTDTKNLGSGVNLNGHAVDSFDVGVKYYGFSMDDLQFVSFLVSDLGGTLGLLDFSRFGIRSKTVGDGSPGSDIGRESSSKEISFGPDDATISIDPSTVPLPTAAWASIPLLTLLGIKRLRNLTT